MGYYGIFRVYVKSTTPVGCEPLVNYIEKNINKLDPESVTAIYDDLNNDELDADAFEVSTLQKEKEEDWFPKNVPGDLYEIKIELKYPTDADLIVLLDAAKACYQDASFIAGTMDDDEYSFSQMDITKAEMDRIQKENL
jgi:hypothetical protein